MWSRALRLNMAEMPRTESPRVTVTEAVQGPFFEAPGALVSDGSKISSPGAAGATPSPTHSPGVIASRESRKRPHPEGLVSDGPKDMKESETGEEEEEKEDDDALFAFRSALHAERAAGRSMKQAVQSMFDSLAADLPTTNRQRLRDLNLSAPITAAIEKFPELAQDIDKIAQMCQAIYDCAEDEIELLRVPRRRLALTFSAFSDVSRIIEGAKNIVVLTGAGVSVSCGIPDFRSKGGLYDTVLERYGLEDPQAIFDLNEFKSDPNLFFSFAKDVMPGKNIQPSATHRFVAELEQRGKLLRIYSQNIDGLERRAGVSDDRLVLCHGSFLTATCMRRSCGANISGDDIAAEVAAGEVPICKKCVGENKKAKRKKRKNGDSSSDEEVDAEGRGVLKPDIVFFGESLPRKVGESLEKDIVKADLLLVLGTSLQVAPVARIPHYFEDSVPRILVNRELLLYDFDVELLGNCDSVIKELRRELKWEEQRCKKDGEAAESQQGRAEGGVVFQAPRRFVFEGASPELREGDESGSEEMVGERNDVDESCKADGGDAGATE